VDVVHRDLSPGVRRMLTLVGAQAPFDHGRQQDRVVDPGLTITSTAVEQTAKEIGADIAAGEHDVKYRRPGSRPNQAGSKRRALRLDSGHRQQDQADASQKLTHPDEDGQILRHRGKPRSTSRSDWFHRA